MKSKKYSGEPRKNDPKAYPADEHGEWKEDYSMIDRPHSRKAKVVEGTAEVKKGERVGGPKAGEDGAPLAGNEKKEENKNE